MKKENLDIINKIWPAIQNIVASECESIFAEYVQLKEQSLINSRKIKDLEREIEKKDSIIKQVNARFDNAKSCLSELHKEWVVNMISGWDEWCDEYWNWWGYIVELVEYKWVQYELMYNSY